MQMTHTRARAHTLHTLVRQRHELFSLLSRARVCVCVRNLSSDISRPIWIISLWINSNKRHNYKIKQNEKEKTTIRTVWLLLISWGVCVFLFVLQLIFVFLLCVYDFFDACSHMPRFFRAYKAYNINNNCSHFDIIWLWFVSALFSNQIENVYFLLPWLIVLDYKVNRACTHDRISPSLSPFHEA